MKRIAARDYQEYPFSAEAIYQVLADITGYKKWWPWGIKVKVLKETPEGLGSKIEVWVSGGWFRCETVSLKPNECVTVQYYEGVVVGDSYWTIEPLGNGKTRVGYIIDLEPHGLLFRTLANIIDISKVHSLQFKRVMKSLHRYLNSISDQTRGY
jgi:ribosome-associated toxin RatA of RatAB toxin-antitoxin module